jgi:hypothetical protein
MAASMRGLLLVVLLLGCSSSSSGSGDPDSGASAACPERCPAPTASSSRPWNCDEPALCPEVVFSSPPGYRIVPPYTLTTPDAARCALEALRDGKAGVISWSTSAAMSTRLKDSQDLIVRKDRAVLVNTWLWSNVSVYVNPTSSRLRDAAFFTDCLALTAPNDLHDCFEQATGGVCK